MNQLCLILIRFYLVHFIQTAAAIEFTCYVKLVTITCGWRTKCIFIEGHFISGFMHHSTLGPIHLMVGGASLLLFQLILSHSSYILILSSAINEYQALFNPYLKKVREMVCGLWYVLPKVGVGCLEIGKVLKKWCQTVCYVLLCIVCDRQRKCVQSS
jgi:hypothetical protein